MNRRTISLSTSAILLCLATPAHAQGQNPPGVNPTHYQCYKVEGPSKPLTLKLIRDQFGGAEGVKVGRPLYLCAPAVKNTLGPRDKTTHYLCYEDEGVKTPNRKVRITNQLGTMELAVETPAMLCVPSLKKLL